MQKNSFNIFVLFICIAFSLQTRAQVKACEGSLGDPVIHQDFGSGSNPGGPLPSSFTNMRYTTSNCPQDGEYTIATSLAANVNTHQYTWYNVPGDHTGNGNGYMMIINASPEPSIFFTEAASGLCPGTTYEFSAYILNLMIPGNLTANFSRPNITFSIESTQGQVLRTYSTDTIPPSPYSTGPAWVKYSTYFTTPANVTNVIVKMVNNAPGGNGNDFILDDITFRACGPVIQEGFASTTGVKNEELCEGSNADFTLKGTVIGSSAPVYQWQSNINDAGWADMPGNMADSIKVSFNNAPPGKYQYRLGVANGAGINEVACRIYSSPLTVKINPLPVMTPFAPQTICEGTSLKLTATGGATYTWTGPNMPPTSKNPLIIDDVSAANAGTYTVVAMSASGCTATPVQAIVKVLPTVVPGISVSTAICAGETTQLNASGGLYYKWTPSTGLDNDTIPNPVARPLQTTIYTAHIGNGSCTDSSKSVTVTVNQNPVANAGADIKMFEGQSVKLNGIIKGDNINFYWTPAIFLDNPLSATPIASPTENITYTLTVASKTCGTSTSSIFVRVYKKIVIPNAFSPNSDGRNDYWDIKELYTYPESSILVFNRYGQRVYQSTGYAKPWDGTHDGSSLAQGTYYYIIDLKNDTPKIAGWVLIVR